MGRAHNFNYLHSGLSVFTYKHRLFTQSTFQWSNVPSTTAAQHARARKLVKHTKTTICTITDRQANREFDRCSPGNLKKANSRTFDPGYQNDASQQTYTAFKTTDTLRKESA